MCAPWIWNFLLCHQNLTFYETVKLDGLVKSQKTPFLVIPAKAGIQLYQYVLDAGSGPA
jgi:hypothetical protein